MAETSHTLSQLDRGPWASRLPGAGAGGILRGPGRCLQSSLPAPAVRACEPIALITSLCFLPDLSTESLFAIHLPRDFIGI